MSVILITWAGGSAGAQALQIAPLGGYQFGGDLYETAAGTALDVDGAAVIGATLDVFLDEASSVSLLYTHQETHVDVPHPTGRRERVRLSIDHWHLGGTQEVGLGRVRPFYAGTLGLTRFGGGGDTEVRFSLAGGGGVKMMPWRQLGVRLDGRVFVVFVDGETTAGICGPAACAVGLHVATVWQVQFTAGLVLSF